VALEARLEGTHRKTGNACLPSVASQKGRVLWKTV